MKFRVLVNKRFGEGWKAGDIVDMDMNSARVPLEEGAIEYLSGKDIVVEENPEAMAVNDLHETKKILDKLGIEFWLTLGTCLGVYRDGTFCKNDWDDIDLGLHSKDLDKLPDIMREMKNVGFKLERKFEPEDGICPEYSFSKVYNNFQTKIDLWFYTPDGDDMIFRFYKDQDAKEWNGKRNPASLFKTFRKIDFHGETYKIPFAIKKYLDMNYGDWKKPIGRDVWDYYNDNQSPNE